MDKYEHRISLQEIDQLIRERRFDEAASVADTIDWSREKDPATLCKVSDIYKINREYAKSRRVLLLANKLDPQNPEIIFSLCELTIFLYGRDGLQTDLVTAYQLNQQYQQMQPGSPKSLILEYKLYKVTNVSAGEKIDILERLKSIQYTPRWGYELALCYREAGDLEHAAAECQSIMNHFQGKYASKASLLLASIQDAGTGSVQQTGGAGQQGNAGRQAQAQPDSQPQPTGGEDNSAESDAQEGRAAEFSGRTAGDFGQPGPGSEGITAGENSAHTEGADAGKVFTESGDTRNVSTDNAGTRNTSAGTANTGTLSSESADTRTISAEGAAAKTTFTEGADTSTIPAMDTNPGSVSAGVQETEKIEDTQTAGNAARGRDDASGNSQSTVAEDAASDSADHENHTNHTNHADHTDPSTQDQSMTISEVMKEWIRIRDNIRSQNDQKRKERLMEDTGSLMDAFDESSRHSMLEDIERNVERQQREARQGYNQSELSDGLTDGERSRAQQFGYYRPVQQYEPDQTDQTPDQNEVRESAAGAPVEAPYDSGYGQAAEPAQTGTADAVASDAAEPAASETAPASDAEPSENIPAEEGYPQYEAPAVPEENTQEEAAATDRPAVPVPPVQGEQFNTAPVPYQDAAFKETLFEDHTAEDASQPAYEPLQDSQAVRTARAMDADARARRAQKTATVSGQDADAYGQPEAFASNISAGDAQNDVEGRGSIAPDYAPLEENAEPDSANEGTEANYDYGTPENSEPAPDSAASAYEPAYEPISGSGSVRREGRTTRRWSAADVRRAMAAQKAGFAAMEAADRAALEHAVQNAGNEAAEQPAEAAKTADQGENETTYQSAVKPAEVAGDETARTQDAAQNRESAVPEENVQSELTQGQAAEESAGTTAAEETAVSEAAEMAEPEAAAESDEAPASGQVDEAEAFTSSEDAAASEDETEPAEEEETGDAVESEDTAAAEETAAEEETAESEETAEPEGMSGPAENAEPAESIEAAGPESTAESAGSADQEAAEEDEPSETEDIEGSVGEGSAAEEELPDAAAPAQNVSATPVMPRRTRQDIAAADRRPARPGMSTAANGRRSQAGRGQAAPAAARRTADLAQRNQAMIQPGHDLSDEEKKLFGPIALVKANRDQIVAAMDNVSLAGETGNVIITGSPAVCKRVSRGLLHMIRHADSNFSSKVAEADGKRLNELGAAKITRLLDKIENGAIQITGAGALSEEILTALQRELEGRERGIIVLLLDSPRAINGLLKKYGKLLRSFNVRIDVHPLDDKALVAYGMEYALQQDYSIDEMAQLALSTRISSLQTRDHHVSTQEVRDLVDEAISYASRKSLRTLFAILTHKRYDADDRIIIRERDFMHY